MEIILMRHGRPASVDRGHIAPVDMERWIEHYNRSLVETDGVPAASLELAGAAACIVASTASRALSSVEALGHTPAIADAIFCEAQLPFAPWRFPRLSPFVWAAFFRLLWFWGYANGSESLREASTRARAAARKLVALAGEGPVLLMGHGIMNHLIAKELRTAGWSGPTIPKIGYWSAGVYRFQS